MQKLSVAVTTIAAVGLAAGSLGMAQASPHQHGALGEDTSLAHSGDSLDGLTRLFGKVNDDRDLTLSDTSLSPGRYRIIIRDATKRHNWHIFGTGVDKETAVRGTGRWSWKVRLRAGTYTVVCDPHAQNMRFSVSVG